MTYGSIQTLVLVFSRRYDHLRAGRLQPLFFITIVKHAGLKPGLSGFQQTYVLYLPIISNS